MAALGKLLEEYRPRLLAMLRRRIDPALAVRISAEDILNEAFLLARRKYEAFKNEPSLSAYSWLYRIVLDCLIEAWRRETRDRRDLARDIPWPVDSSIQLGMGLVGTGTSPSEAAARRQMAERMQHTLELLSPKDKNVIWMRHFDGLTHGEAAEVLGISEGAATLRYVRALKRLRDLWYRLHGESDPP